MFGASLWFGVNDRIKLAKRMTFQFSIAKKKKRMTRLNLLRHQGVYNLQGREPTKFLPAIAYGRTYIETWETEHRIVKSKWRNSSTTERKWETTQSYSDWVSLCCVPFSWFKQQRHILWNTCTFTPLTHAENQVVHTQVVAATFIRAHQVNIYHGEDHLGQGVKDGAKKEELKTDVTILIVIW